MRIYIASLWQETNSFSPKRTGLDLFESGYRLAGRQIVDRLAGTNTEIGGFLDQLGKQPDVEIVPGTAAWAVPSGKLKQAAFEELLGDLIAGLKKSLPVDGVLLALHGALASEETEDCEGRVLEEVRQLVGPKVPVVSSLDYHACLTRQMVENTDLLVGYRTYPHVDYAETGQRTAAALLRRIAQPRKLNVEFVQLPLILPAENSETGKGPMAPVIERLWALDKMDGIEAASVFSTQPWLDVKDHGTTVLLYADEKAEAGKAAQEMADYLWRSREQFFLKYSDIRTYLNGFASQAKPAIVVDSGDITSAGSVGDSTEILRALLERSAPPKSLLAMVNPQAMEAANRIGEGGTGTFTVGDGGLGSYNAPATFRGRVAKLSADKVTVKGTSFAGMTLDMGRRALLVIDETIYLMVTEKTSLLHDPEIVRTMGVQPEDFELIAQKSHKLFRAAYETIARSVTLLDTPGFSDMNLKRLPFQQVRRPIYPLDDLTERTGRL